jgi:Na+/melibiose symporter-like transporter
MMDDAFRENVHFFMIGLGIVCILGVALLFVFYFRLKQNVKKSKENESQD